ncbi:MAG: formylmethanofuran dehydrogenase subunit C [Burkholderiales bacterium]|jgi:formylmethanofuran dehydrogenase subunit C
MTPLILTLRKPARFELDISAVTPDRLAGVDVKAVALPGGRRLGELFDITGEDRQNIIIRNPDERLTHVGAGMRKGVLTVEGNCGAYAGLGMRGGTLIIEGNTGDFAGAAVAGSRQGMRGGIVAIHGNAGDRAGERMRRGLMLIRGEAGAYCGANMLAGTILVLGQVGPMPGFQLKRGSLLLAHTPNPVPATFQDSGEHSLLFLTLLEKQLRRDHHLANFLPPISRPVRRYCGDMACGGTGEMLVFA